MCGTEIYLIIPKKNESVLATAISAAGAREGEISFHAPMIR
jgi:hypothetical protein